MPIETLGPKIYNLPDGITSEPQRKVKPTISRFIDSNELEAAGHSAYTIDIGEVHFGRFYVISNQFTVLVWDGEIDFLHLEEEAVSAIQSAENKNQSISLTDVTNRAAFIATFITKEEELVYELANPDKYASYQQLLKTPEEIIRATYDYTIRYTFSAENPAYLTLPDQKPELTVGVMKSDLYPEKVVDWALNHHASAEVLREKTDAANIAEILSKIEGVKLLVGKSHEEVVIIKDKHAEELMRHPLINGQTSISEGEDEQNRFVIIKASLDHEPTPEEKVTLPEIIDGVPIQYEVVTPIADVAVEPNPNDISDKSATLAREILQTLRGETKQLNEVPANHLDWSGIEAFLDIYESTRGTVRESMVQAIGEVLKSAHNHPIEAAHLIDLVSDLNITQLQPIIEQIQVDKLVGGNGHLQDAINNYFALRKLYTLE